jgi:hypothetical protein
MLLKFSVANFRGFPERIEWDLSKHSNYTFNDYAIKDGVIKNGILYGPNGAGKTNFSLAIFDIVNHLTQTWKKADYYKNYVYAGKPDMPVVFEYTFKFGQRVVQYDYSKNSDGRLIAESLIVDGHTVFSLKNNEFFIDESQFPIDSAVKDKLRENANHLSIVNYLLTSFPLTSDHYLIQLQNFVNSMLWFRCLNVTEFIGLDHGVTNLSEYIISNNLVRDFQQFLSDVGEQKFEFVEPVEGDKYLYCKYGKNKVRFFDVASTGTQSLELLYYWLKQMDKASFVFIDEFDAFYHYKLSFEVCKRLFSLNCQAFTSSHNTYLMTNDLLRPDCNFIINNNKIKPLNECTEKELRFGHNIEKMYRGGAFEV